DYSIFGNNGEYLFSIGFPGIKQNSYLIILPVLSWALFLLMLIIITDDLLLIAARRRGRMFSILLKTTLYIAAYLLFLFDIYPEVFSKTALFQTAGFSLGKLSPTMGHLLLAGILLSSLARTLYRQYKPLRPERSRAEGDFLSFTLVLIPGTVMFILFHQVLTIMISHTNLVFEGYRVSQLSIHSVAGILSLFFLITVPCFYVLRVIETFRSLTIRAFFSGVMINILILVPLALFGLRSGVVTGAFFLLLVVVFRYHAIHRLGKYTLSAAFSIIFSLYLAWHITIISSANESDSLRVSAVTLATMHDPVAEHLLIGMSPAIGIDPQLKERMMSESFNSDDAEWVSSHLIDKHFTGYWTNYSLSVVLCNHSSQLLVGDGNGLREDCFEFFAEKAARQGQVVTGTPFYFMESNTGRPSYLGIFYFDLPAGKRNGLFIELFSYVNDFREGYPELLTDDRYMRPQKFRGYSTAKYIDGSLVLNTGSYSYPLRDTGLSERTEEYHAIRMSGYDHFIYRHGKVTIVQSRKTIPFINRVITFAYLYIFIQLITGFFILVFSREHRGSIISLTLRQKLQAAFSVVILVTFAGVAAGAIWLSIIQYRGRHYENLREKANSLYIELQHKLENEAALTTGWTDGKYMSLNDLLVKFSNVFFTDINLFDASGNLLATSRPELFLMDLTSSRMNRFALGNLSAFSESEYIATERIGEFEYMSIYVPFHNARNELLAYLNVPYFGMQAALSDEIANLIVAIINFSLLMIIATMSIAVFLSDRLTAPVRMLGEVLSSVRLGRKSERLVYKSGDEIGELVRQYNKMVEELEESTLKLAASEREYAWREMAKQIAHEIKNPLTPMKLNVQQLEKAWRDARPGFEKKLERFTRNQIEHIDTLSSIATAFSNFARMPGSNPVHIDLLDQIKSTLELFKNSGNILFRISCVQTTRIIVMADKEHLNSIFSNIIKNAIQAIPDDRNGIIRVAVSLAGDRVEVNISDNGTGIPTEARGKMFTPHFTTKSSGSGLGLSIVKRLVEGIGGEIYFESEPGEGTAFTIILPVLYSVERPE
ncbi:MAG: HAMP domain-containing protein, partial [Bacteroidetes bacterium]|nr:HAMP domain-containing protein [Bacteroidota bacterium]